MSNEQREQLPWRLALGFIGLLVAILGYLADHRLTSLEARLDAVRDLAVTTASRSEANSKMLEQLQRQQDGH